MIVSRVAFGAVKLTLLIFLVCIVSSRVVRMQLTREDLLGRASCFCGLMSVCPSDIFIIRTDLIRVVMCVRRDELWCSPRSACAKTRLTADGTTGEGDPLPWRPPCLPISNCATDLGRPCSLTSVVRVGNRFSGHVPM